MKISWRCCVASCFLGFVFCSFFVAIAIIELPADEYSTVVVCNET